MARFKHSAWGLKAECEIETLILDEAVGGGGGLGATALGTGCSELAHSPACL